MSYQCRVLYLFVFLIFFLSSCIPSVPPSDNAGSGGSVTVPPECMKEGYETYLIGTGEYCFVYPSGYSRENTGNSESVTLTHSLTGNMPFPVDGSVAMNALPLTLSGTITLLIHYEDRHKDDDLSELVERDLRGSVLNFQTPWLLDGEKAELVKTTQADSSPSYTVYAKHGDNYYQLMFTSSARLLQNSPSATKLEELFFTVMATFKFLK